MYLQGALPLRALHLLGALQLLLTLLLMLLQLLGTLLLGALLLGALLLGALQQPLPLQRCVITS